MIDIEREKHLQGLSEGQQATFRQIERICKESAQKKCIVVRGLSGTGKSELFRRIKPFFSQKVYFADRDIPTELTSKAAQASSVLVISDPGNIKEELLTGLHREIITITHSGFSFKDQLAWLDMKEGDLNLIAKNVHVGPSEILAFSLGSRVILQRIVARFLEEIKEDPLRKMNGYRSDDLRILAQEASAAIRSLIANLPQIHTESKITTLLDTLRQFAPLEVNGIESDPECVEALSNAIRNDRFSSEGERYQFLEYLSRLGDKKSYDVYRMRHRSLRPDIELASLSLSGYNVWKSCLENQYLELILNNDEPRVSIVGSVSHEEAEQFASLLPDLMIYASGDYLRKTACGIGTAGDGLYGEEPGHFSYPFYNQIDWTQLPHLGQHFRLIKENLSSFTPEERKIIPLKKNRVLLGAIAGDHNTIHSSNIGAVASLQAWLEQHGCPFLLDLNSPYTGIKYLYDPKQKNYIKCGG